MKNHFLLIAYYKLWNTRVFFWDGLCGFGSSMDLINPTNLQFAEMQTNVVAHHHSNQPPIIYFLAFMHVANMGAFVVIKLHCIAVVVWFGMILKIHACHTFYAFIRIWQPFEMGSQTCTPKTTFYGVNQPCFYV